MSDSKAEFSISEFQKLNEYASSSDESPNDGPPASDSSVEQPEDSNSPEEETSDEEIDFDLNNLGSLVSQVVNKPKSYQTKDIDSLFATTKLKRKKEDELKIAKKVKSAQISRHFAKLDPKKEEKEAEIKEVTFKEWHVPLMEVPTREQPKPKRRKKVD